MKCLRCENEAATGKAVCASCLAGGRSGSGPSAPPPPTSAPPEAIADNNSEQANDSGEGVMPAGFWLRVFARWIDTAILSVPVFLISTSGLSAILARNSTLPAENSFPVMAMVVGALWVILAFACVEMLLCFVYNPIFECSPLQATPGKMFLNLIVVNDECERLSGLEALARNFARGLPRMLAAICVFLGIVITKSGYGQYALPMAFLGVLVFTFGEPAQYLMAAFGPNKQTVYDLLARTHVVRARDHGVGWYFLRATVALIISLCAVHYFGPQRSPKTDVVRPGTMQMWPI